MVQPNESHPRRVVDARLKSAHPAPGGLGHQPEIIAKIGILVLTVTWTDSVKIDRFIGLGSLVV